MVILLAVLVIGCAVWFTSSRRGSAARRLADDSPLPAPPAGLLTARPLDSTALAAGEIVVRELSKQYRNVTAVRDLTFTVAPGLTRPDGYFAFVRAFSSSSEALFPNALSPSAARIFWRS
jgi:hypothetical protein